MATIRDIQNQINNNTFDPNKYSRAERDLIDAAIEKGLITGPSVVSTNSVESPSRVPARVAVEVKLPKSAFKVTFVCPATPSLVT